MNKIIDQKYTFGPEGADTFSPAIDLVDFYNRWPEFKPLITQIISNRVTNEGERVMLSWLVELADRVSAQDVCDDGW